MLRSFGNRPDTAVDEPLYAHYLQVTGAAHPLRDGEAATARLAQRRRR
jgi:hypothetical protein